MLTRARDLGTKTMTVRVGDGDTLKTFLVHEKLICERSEFFRTCVNGNWEEYKDGVVTLPKDNPELFQLYIQSLYVSSHAHAAIVKHSKELTHLPFRPDMSPWMSQQSPLQLNSLH
jgi:hypothetical protein